MEELDITRFNTLITKVLSLIITVQHCTLMSLYVFKVRVQLDSDPATVAFGQYFKKYYVCCPEQWASCYRRVRKHPFWY